MHGDAATEVGAGGVVSPGGVGFDISCGVRLLAADLAAAGLRPRLAELMDDLERRGIAVRPASWRGLAEEAPAAYKDVDAVVATSQAAGLGRLVVRLVPLGVVKG